MVGRSKTKYTKRRPRPLNQSEFARLVGVSHTAIGGYVKKGIIKMKAGSRRFNPVRARESLRARILQGLQVKMELNFLVGADGECYQAANTTKNPQDEWPDPDDILTAAEKERAAKVPEEKLLSAQSSFDYDAKPTTPAAAQMRKMIIDADHKLIQLRALQGLLFDPQKYIPDFEAVLTARDKGISDKIQESIEQTVAHCTDLTDHKKVREMQTKIIHGVLKNIVTLSIIDYLPAELADRIRAAGNNDGLRVG